MADDTLEKIRGARGGIAELDAKMKDDHGRLRRKINNTAEILSATPIKVDKPLGVKTDLAKTRDASHDYFVNKDDPLADPRTLKTDGALNKIKEARRKIAELGAKMKESHKRLKEEINEIAEILSAAQIEVDKFLGVKRGDSVNDFGPDLAKIDEGHDYFVNNNNSLLDDPWTLSDVLLTTPYMNTGLPPQKGSPDRKAVNKRLRQMLREESQEGPPNINDSFGGVPDLVIPEMPKEASTPKTTPNLVTQEVPGDTSSPLRNNTNFQINKP